MAEIAIVVVGKAADLAPYGVADELSAADNMLETLVRAESELLYGALVRRRGLRPRQYRRPCEPLAETLAAA
jgi:hypothetical protein